MLASTLLSDVENIQQKQKEDATKSMSCLLSLDFLWFALLTAVENRSVSILVIIINIIIVIINIVVG